MRKRIMIPLWNQYYLFDYFQYLIPVLLKRGFNVVVITDDAKVYDKYQYDSKSFSIEPMPKVLHFLRNRSGKVFFRVLLWSVARAWSFKVRKRYDFVIVPWDHKPTWYCLSSKFDSMTIHNTTEYMDVDLNRQFGLDQFKKLHNEKKISYKICCFLDFLTRGNFHARNAGVIGAYPPKKLIVDRMMGFRFSYNQGDSNVNYVTVTGMKVKICMPEFNVDPRKIHVVGNPSYENIFHIKKSFNSDERKKVRSDLSVPDEKKLFTFFLSPTDFPEPAIEEIVLMANKILECDEDSFVLLKFHPKVNKTDPALIISQITPKDRVRCIAKYTGDEYNARLILSSHCLIQKQCTVVLMAILLDALILSYNIIDTAVHDDLCKVLDLSIHIESIESLKPALKMLEDPIEIDNLRKRQSISSKNYCLIDGSPCEKIADIIESHFR